MTATPGIDLSPARPAQPVVLARRRSWSTIAVLVAMTTLQVSLTAFSLYVLSAVRAYVTGESLYSKGQKDAQIYLVDYAENRRESDYQNLIRALSVPIADRHAREELQKADPDLGAALQAFLDGGNHPEDVNALVRVFLWFGRTPLMSTAIATWTEGDRAIEQMRLLVEDTHDRVRAGQTDAEAFRQIRLQAPELNRRLTHLESEFSHQLGQASRQTQKILLLLNGLFALVLTLSGIAFVRRSASIQARTEAEVVRRQESLQNLLDSAAEGLFGVDSHGRCTFVNRAALRMLGYDREQELFGQPILERIGVSTAEAQASGTPADAGRYSDSELYRRRDGSVIPVEHWSYPMLRDGRVEGTVTTFFDISERIRLRSELRRGQIVMERLVGEVSDGVITFDDARRILVFNGAAQKLFQMPAVAALGSPVERLFEGELPPRALADPRPGAVYALTGRRAETGELFQLEASFSRMQTDDGNLNTIVVRDVTEREQARIEREAREALEAANRARTQFLSRMSHELRTPLNAVLGFSQLLQVDGARSLTPLQLERIAHIEKAGHHLLALVNDVLDLSRIDAGEMAVSAESVELGAAVDEAATMTSPLVTQAGVELVVIAPPDGSARLHKGPFLRTGPAAVWVSADPVRLRQVLVNLLSNAVKYNRPGGSVTLSWRVQDDVCVLSVADTGIGMSADKVAQLFEPFNRLGAESSRVEGTGIGLALSRRLCELMGARLDVTSRPAEGTVATVTLALARPTPKLVAAPRSDDAREAAPATALDVIYAEDNEVNAELVRQIVRSRPAISLRIAQSGQEALAMARAEPPDLMLVDMNLGDMTGLELARALRFHVQTRGIELVALSADVLPEQIAAALRQGFRDYLTKPVDFHRVLALLDDRLRVATQP